MPRLIWTPAALKDIARLRAFLQPSNPDAARRAVSAIRRGVRALKRLPLAGRPMNKMPPEFRQWSIDFGSSSYLVAYRVEVDAVVVIAVRHGREFGGDGDLTAE